MKEIQTKQIPCFKRWMRKSYAIFASLHRYVTIGVLAVGMSILLLADVDVRAAEVDTLAILKVASIDEVAIVGSKVSPMRSTMTQTTLYEREPLASAPVTTLETALRLSPSIDLRERGGKGVQADISIRGGSFDQTMVLLNGIDFTDARTGHQTHSLPIDMECIASIALIDGMTGVGAYAGAVDIRTAPLIERYLRLEASGGGDGYAYANLSGAIGGGGLTAFAAGSYRRSDGHTANTGFENVNGYVRLDYQSARAGLFDFQAGYQQRSFGANGFYSLAYPLQWEQTHTGLASLRWVKGWGRFTLHASGSYRKNLDRFELIRNRPDLVPFNYHDTDHAGARLWGDLRSAAGLTSLGGDYSFNHIWSTVLGEPVADPRGRYDHARGRHVGNLWLRHAKSFRRFDVAAAAGVALTPYGEYPLWSFSAGYRPAPGWRVEAGVTQSMRLPTFTDLYYTATGYRSNPSLEPEQAVTYRLAADFWSGDWRASLRTYYRAGRDIIDWVRPASEAYWESQQITSLGTFGIEYTAGYVPGHGFLRRATCAYGYIATDKASGEQLSKYALDYMRHKATLTVELALGRAMTLSLIGSVYDRRGSYVDRAGQTIDYEPYFLLDGRFTWNRNKLRLYLDATNLTDCSYFDFGGLPMPGMWFGGGIVVTIG